MASGKKLSRLNQTVSDQALILGLQKHEAVITSLLVGGTNTPTSRVIGTLQARVSAANATLAAKATWQAALDAEEHERETTKVFVSRVRQALKLAFADQVDMLADFGLTPTKTPSVPPATKVTAAAKAKATRVARHTLGPKQKLAIHGTMPVTVATHGGVPAATTPAGGPQASTTAPGEAPKA